MKKSQTTYLTEPMFSELGVNADENRNLYSFFNKILQIFDQRLLQKVSQTPGLGLRKLKVLEKSEDIVSVLPSQGMVWPVGMAKGHAYLLAEVGTKDENKLKTMTVLFGNHVHLVFPQEF